MEKLVNKMSGRLPSFLNHSFDCLQKATICKYAKRARKSWSYRSQSNPRQGARVRDENDSTADLLPLPADLALVLLHPDISVDALAADELKVAVPPISLFVLQRVHNSKVVLGTPATVHKP